MSYQVLTHIPYKTLKLVVFDFVSGEKISKIAKKYELTPQVVRNITSGNIDQYLDNYNTSLLKVASLRENERINEIKDELYDYITTLAKEANNESLDTKTRLYFSTQINNILSNLDRIARLNNSQATEISENRNENRNTNVDVAQILKELDTPEKQKAFLLGELDNINKR